MKRILFWTSLVVCAAIGIGMPQSLIAFAETTSQKVVPDEEVPVDEADTESGEGPNANSDASNEAGDRNTGIDAGETPTEVKHEPREEWSWGNPSGGSIDDKVNVEPLPDEDMTFAQCMKKYPLSAIPIILDAMSNRDAPAFFNPRRHVVTNSILVLWSKSQVPNHIYGYSSTTGTWDRFTPPRTDESPSDIVPLVSSGMAATSIGNSVAAFGANSGKWQVISVDTEVPRNALAVGTSYVTFSSGGHSYIYQDGRDAWGSPTDRHLNTKSPAAEERQAVVEEAKPTDHHDDGHTIAQLEEAWEYAERKTIDIAQKLQPADGSEDELKQQKQELRDAVESAFSARRLLQEARMNEMQEKLSQIKTTLQSRAQRRDRIIERRVEELQDPNLNWESLRSSGRRSNTVRNRSESIRRVPVGGSAGLSLNGPGPGVLATGTPIGLPGPPDEPLGAVDATIVVNLYGGEDVLPQMNTDGPNKAKHVKLLQDLNAIEGVTVNILRSGSGNEILLAIVRDPTAGLQDIPRELSARRVAIARALKPVPGVRWEAEGQEPVAALTIDARDGDLGGSTMSGNRVDAQPATNAFPPPESADSAPPAFTGISRNAAKNLPAFDWEKADELEERMGLMEQQILKHRQSIETVSSMLKRLNVSWDDASTEHRVEVERLLRGETSRGLKVSVGDDLFMSDNVGPVQRQPIAEDKERYERLRLERLKYECDSLEMYLAGSTSTVAALRRYWGQYQGDLGELELRVKEAELVYEAALRVLELKTARDDAVGIDQFEMINAKLAFDRAKIGHERAKNHVQRLLRIGKENPSFEPDQYREELASFQKLLDGVREENPELESITVPGGTGGGVF